MKSRSLVYKTWQVFLLFAAVMLMGIWLLQTVFMMSFYKTMKTKEVKRLSNDIITRIENGDDLSIIENEATAKNIAIYIIDRFGYIKYPKIFMSSVITELRDDVFSRFRSEFNQKGTDEVLYETKSQGYTNLTYGKRLNISKEPLFLYVFTTIEPTDTTTAVIKSQLVLVGAASFLLAGIISIFFSKKLANPIEKLTSAVRLGDENFEFKSEINEIDELAKTMRKSISDIKQADEFKRDLYANVTHDLKTPLTIIKSYAEMIDDISGDDPVKRKEDLGVIKDEVDRLTSLIDRVLTLSKLESKVENLKYEKIELKGETEDVLNRLLLLDTKLDVKISDYCKSEITADRQLMSQVIYNLISNAIRHGDGKIIFVNIEEVSDKPGTLRYSVRNTGALLNEEELKTVFDKYYSKSKNFSRDKSGTGLGLYMVRVILELHGFMYGVISNKEDGVTFYFEAPIAK